MKCVFNLITLDRSLICAGFTSSDSVSAHSSSEDNVIDVRLDSKGRGRHNWRNSPFNILLLNLSIANVLMEEWNFNFKALGLKK